MNRASIFVITLAALQFVAQGCAGALRSTPPDLSTFPPTVGTIRADSSGLHVFTADSAWLSLPIAMESDSLLRIAWERSDSLYQEIVAAELDREWRALVFESLRLVDEFALSRRGGVVAGSMGIATAGIALRNERRPPIEAFPRGGVIFGSRDDPALLSRRILSELALHGIEAAETLRGDSVYVVSWFQLEPREQRVRRLKRVAYLARIYRDGVLAGSCRTRGEISWFRESRGFRDSQWRATEQDQTPAPSLPRALLPVRQGLEECP